MVEIRREAQLPSVTWVPAGVISPSQAPTSLPCVLASPSTTHSATVDTISSMWLLNAKTYGLEYFHDASVIRGKYAILSHTWGEEEVSFQQIQDLEAARRLRGLEKIRLTCEQALRDGLSYAWVDTCCIDKKSSAELSEAINSMFWYYKMSFVCYVFLSDVTTTRDDIADLAHTDTAPKWLASSRWFRRGWTLQELIAPHKNIFFTKHWQHMGSKADMLAILATITGIHLAVLSSSDALVHYSVAQRMSWAVDRETTRLEDRAYSLFGLFDINMPLLYGEGTAAFRRLQEEIIKRSDDHSIFLWTLPGDPWGEGELGTVLAPTPDHFRKARNVVQHQYSTSRSFELTNSGLRIQLCKKSGRGITYLIFNCRYCDDFRGPIALPIVDTEFVASDGGLQSPDIPRYAPRRDLQVLPIEDLGVLEPKSCLLVDDLQLYPRINVPVTLSLWVREEATSSKKFWITEVYPRDRWNGASSVMQWTRAPPCQFGAWGYVTWRRRHAEFFITLMFKLAFDTDFGSQNIVAVTYTTHSLSGIDCQRWAESIGPLQSGTFLYHVSAGSDEAALFVKQNIVPFQGPGRLEFLARNESLFGHPVCVVDISLRGDPATLSYDRLHAT